jgi:cytochrome P450
MEKSSSPKTGILRPMSSSATVAKSSLPRAPRLPIVGSLPALVHERLAFLDRARARCGDVFSVDLGVDDLVIVADPEVAEDILIHRSKHFDKGGAFWEGAREAVGNGLAFSEGELWRRQRRLMNPEFRRERIAGFRATIRATVEELLRELEGPAARREALDISAWTSKLLATLTVRILFGGELNPHTFDRLRDAFGVVLDRMMSGLVTRQLPAWLPVPGAARFDAARETLDELILAVIAERRASPREGDDLLGMLLTAADDEGKMSDRQLRDEVVVTFIAGYETTAWALAWGLMLLAERPATVAELQAEIDAHEDMLAVPLLDATVREILRLYPSAPLIPRRATVDEELLGHRIPAGSVVMVSPWLIHRNPKVWPDPLRFDPHRHLEDVKRPKLAWMPFGAGQRLCIGMGLALMEANLALGMLLLRFTPAPVPGRKRAEPRLSTTLSTTDGVWIRLAPRPEDPPITPGPR